MVDCQQRNPHSAIQGQLACLVHMCEYRIHMENRLNWFQDRLNRIAKTIVPPPLNVANPHRRLCKVVRVGIGFNAMHLQRLRRIIHIRQ